MVLIGYTRVSTGLKNLDMQMDALTQHGCTKIFRDKMSGIKKTTSGIRRGSYICSPGRHNCGLAVRSSR
jgi:DNA invertase Pin-like site-specific DNA recombinase